MQKLLMRAWAMKPALTNIFILIDESIATERFLEQTKKTRRKTHFRGICAKWQPHGESNPDLQDENLLS